MLFDILKNMSNKCFDCKFKFCVMILTERNIYMCDLYLRNDITSKFVSSINNFV